MQTHLTHINTTFEHCHVSVNLDYVDVLYLEDGNIHIYSGSDKQNRNYVFSQKKTFLVY